MLKYEKEIEAGSAQHGISVLEYFPGQPQLPLFTDYAAYFAAIQAWMPRAITPDRVGVRELQPGVWVARQSHISPEAQLHAPCWVGKSVFAGARAVIGPNVVLEDGAFIEPDAVIKQSLIGAHTFVGRFSEIADSIALGNHLINWKTGAAAKVPDPFVLCALRRPPRPRTAKWLARLAEIYSGNKEEDHVLAKELLMNKGGQS